MVPKGAVFPSMPVGGGAPKIARAKRLNPGDTDHGGKTKGDAASQGDPASNPSLAAVDTSEAVANILMAGAVAVVVGLGVVAYLLTRSPDDAEENLAAAIVPNVGATGTLPKPAAAAPTPSATPSPTATTPTLTAHPFGIGHG